MTTLGDIISQEIANTNSILDERNVHVDNVDLVACSGESIFDNRGAPYIAANVNFPEILKSLSLPVNEDSAVPEDMPRIPRSAANTSNKPLSALYDKCNWLQNCGPVDSLTRIEKVYNAKYRDDERMIDDPITDQEIQGLYENYLKSYREITTKHNDIAATLLRRRHFERDYEMDNDRDKKQYNPISCPLDKEFRINSDKVKFILFYAAQNALCRIQQYVRSRVRVNDGLINSQSLDAVIEEVDTQLLESMERTPGMSLVRLWLKFVLLKYIRDYNSSNVNKKSMDSVHRKFRIVENECAVNMLHHGIISMCLINARCNGAVRVLQDEVIKAFGDYLANANEDEISRNMSENVFIAMLAFRIIADINYVSKMANETTDRIGRSSLLMGGRKDAYPVIKIFADANEKGWLENLKEKTQHFWEEKIARTIRTNFNELARLGALFPAKSFPEDAYTGLLNTFEKDIRPENLYIVFNCLGFTPAEKPQLANFRGLLQSQEGVTTEGYAEWVLCFATLTSIDKDFEDMLHIAFISHFNKHGYERTMGIKEMLNGAFDRMLEKNMFRVIVDKLKFQAVARTLHANFEAFFCTAVCKQITQVLPARLTEFTKAVPIRDKNEVASVFCQNSDDYYKRHIATLENSYAFYTLLNEVAAYTPKERDELRIQPLITLLKNVATAGSSNSKLEFIQVMYRTCRCEEYGNSFSSKFSDKLREEFDNMKEKFNQGQILEKWDTFQREDAKTPKNSLFYIVMNDFAYTSTIRTLNGENTSKSSLESYAKALADRTKRATGLPVVAAYLFEHGTRVFADSLNKTINFEEVPYLDGFFAYKNFDGTDMATSEPLQATKTNLTKAQSILSEKFTRFIVEEHINYKVARTLAENGTFNHFCDVWNLKKLLEPQYHEDAIKKNYKEYRKIYVDEYAELTSTPFISGSGGEDTEERFKEQWESVVMNTPQGKAKWLYSEWKWLRNRTDHTYNMINWLQRNKLALNVEGKRLENELRDIKEGRNEYNEKVKAFKPFQANKLVHFFENKSEMFINKFEQITGSSGSERKDINDIFDETLSFFVKLFEFNGLTYADAKEILDICGRYLTSFENEVSVFMSFPPFKKHFEDASQSIDTARILEVLKIAEEIGTYSDMCEKLLNVAQNHSLLDARVFGSEQERLQSVRSRIKSETSVTELSDINKALREIIGDIDLPKLRFFYHANVYSSLYNFFEKLRSYENFAERKDLVRKFHKNPRESAILNSLDSVQIVYEGLIDFARSEDPRRNLRDLCAKVAGLMPRKAIQSFYTKMETVNSEIVTLSAWFGNPKGGQILTGIYESRITGGLFLRCSGSGIVYDAAYVNEAVRRSVVFDKRGSEDIEEYSSYNTVANEFQRIITDLEKLGHPYYQSGPIYINKKKDGLYTGNLDEGRMTLEEFKKAKEDAEKELNEWQKTLKNSTEEVQRLKFLNAKQLLQLGKTLYMEEKEDEKLKALMPFLSNIFPDVELSQKGISGRRLSFSIKNKFKPLLKPENPEGVICGIVKFIKAVGSDNNIIPKAKEDTHMEVEKDKVPMQVKKHKLAGRSLDAVYKRLLCIYNRVVPRPYIFACTEKTTYSELSNFLERVKTFEDMKFSLLEVNRLTIDLKDYLLRYVLELLEGDEASTSGELHLIFTGSSGLDLFNFLPLETPETPEINKIVKERINEVHVYGDEALTGKSHCIINSLPRQSRVINIVVNEQFTASRGIQILKQDETRGDVNIVFDVSPYAPLDVFGHFMYDFIVLGMISDPQSGEMFMPPNSEKVNIYIELHAAPTGDDECSYTEVRDVLEMIPLLKDCTKSYKDEKITESLIETDDLKFAANAFVMHNTDSFNADNFRRSIYCLGQKDFISNDDLKLFIGALDHKIGKGNVTTKAKYVRFFSYYCEELWAYFVHLKETNKDPNQVAAKTLFRRTMNGIISVMDQYVKFPLKTVTRCIMFPLNSEPKILDFEEGSKSAPKTEYELEVLGLEDVLKSPDLLTGLMNSTFKTTLSKELMDQRGYVLTPDFAIKFMVIENCRAAGQNVVLSGDTGTGKSEFIDIYSMLVNLRCGKLPVRLRALIHDLPSSPDDAFKSLKSIENISDFYSFVRRANPNVYREIVEATIKLIKTFQKDVTLPDSVTEAAKFAYEYVLYGKPTASVNGDNAGTLRDLLNDMFSHEKVVHSEHYLSDYVESIETNAKDMKNSSELNKWIRDVTVMSREGKSGEVLKMLMDQKRTELIQLMLRLARETAARIYEDNLFTKFTRLEEKFPEDALRGMSTEEFLRVLPTLLDASGSCVIPRGFEETLEFLRNEAYCAERDNIGTTRESVLRFVESKASSEGTEGFHRLCDFVGCFVARHVRRYRLVKPTPLMVSTAKWWLKRSDAPLKTVEDIKNVLYDVWNEQVTNFFHKIQMHQHITPEAFVKLVESVNESAHSVALEGSTQKKDITVIGFIDECTSSSVMGMVKEVLVDNKLNGKPLASNIMWIGAFNYNAVNARAKVSAGDFVNLDTGLGALSEEIAGNLDFAVRPPPPSLSILEVEFNPMVLEQQNHFIKLLLKLRSSLDVTSVGSDEGNLNQAFETLSFSHDFLKNANQHRIHPSIRDLIRSVDLYTYFRRHPEYYGFSESDADEHIRHYHSLILALSFCYYFRMEPRTRARYALEFGERFPGLLSGNTGDPAMVVESDLFYDVFRKCSMILYRETGLLNGVAPTDSFLQNLFMTVVCIDAKVPLMIMGPPGCSKTLSFTVATGNMKGAHSHMNFYKKLSKAHPIRYQCSKDSADTEIEEVYKNARERQEEDDSVAADAAEAAARTPSADGERALPAGPGARCVVLLDEAGLPDERKAPLKVLHYMLDHPRVSSIILTNKVLDAAKTNRAALLLQSAPSESDLTCLAETCIYEHNAHNANEKVTKAVARAYTRVINMQNSDEGDNKITTVSNYYHLRDFVYFLRYLGRVVNVEHGNPTEPKALVRALLRNFGGTTKDRFVELAKIFAEEINPSLEYVSEVGKQASKASPIEALRESLNENIRDKRDPNSAPFRYTMVIDPSDSEVSLSLLSSLGLCPADTTQFCRVTNFGNNWEKARTDSIIAVKEAMEVGKTVVLVNPLAISSSFYDVLNRHFEVFVDESSQGEGAGQRKDDDEEHYQYFAYVTIGSSSQPCSVSPNFRLVVHLPYSALKKTPAPFLNRFEKYYISLGTCIDDKLHAMTPTQRLSIACLRCGCNNMLKTLRGNQFFYGLVPEETVNSLIKPVVDRMAERNENMPKVEPPFKDYVKNVNKDTGMEVEEEEAEEVDDQRSLSLSDSFTRQGTDSLNKLAIRTLNFHMFQLARPECVFGEKRMPEEYLREYLTNQEHFSVAEHIGKVVSRAGAPGVPTKWCIFTRSCGELSRLDSDSKLTKELFHFANIGNGNGAITYSVFSLLNIKSIEQCNQVMEDARDKDVVVCIADMQTCNSDQINYVRTQISTLQRTQGTKARAFFVILHFPPELQLLHNMSSGQGMFVDDWEFTFIDHLGFFSDESGEVKFAQSDIKKWLLHVFGLGRNYSVSSSNDNSAENGNNDDDNSKKDDDDTTDNDLSLNFEEVHKAFREKLVNKIYSLCPKINPIGRNKNVLSKKGTDAYKNTNNMKKAIKTFIENNPKAVDKYVSRVIRIWCTKLLKDVLRKGAADIQKGRRSTGFIQLINDTLEKFFRPGAEEFIKILCNNYNLQALLEMEKEEKELVERVMSRAPICLVNDLCRHITQGRMKPLSLTYGIKIPSYLPLFTVIAKRVEDIISRARSKDSARDCRSISTFVELLNQLYGGSIMDSSMKFVEGSENLLRWYKYDFVVRVLGLTNLYVSRSEIKKTPGKAIWLDACVLYVEKLMGDNPNSILHLHLVPYFHKREIVYFVKAIAPLRTLKEPPSELLGELESVNLSCADDIPQNTLAICINILYKRFFNSVKPESANNDTICNVMEAFREFRCRFPFRSNVVRGIYHNSEDTPGALDVLRKMDVLYVVQLFLLSIGSAIACAGEGVPLQDILLSAVRDVAGKSETMIPYGGSLERALQLGCELIKSIQSATINSSTGFYVMVSRASFMRSIARYFVEYDTVDDACMEIPQFLLRDVRYLLHLCLGTSSPSLTMMSSREYMGKSPLVWMLETVGCMLKKKPLSWSNKVVNIMETEDFGERREIHCIDLLNTNIESMGVINYASYMLQVQIGVQDIENASFEGSLATRAAFTTRLLKALAKKLSDKDYKSEEFDNMAKLFNEIKKCQDIKNVNLAFFTSFKNSKDAMSICYRKEILSKLGLDIERYYVPEERRLGIISQPPYILFTNHPLHRIYCDVLKHARSGDGVRFAESMRGLIESNKSGMPYIVNVLRMMLVSVSYYEFFLEGLECPAINNAVPMLKEDLNIASELEDKALRYFAHGAYEGNPSQDVFYDPLLNLFSSRAREQSDMCVMSHEFANVLAFTMGIPKNSGHTYERIFKVNDLDSTYGPGATYLRLNQDCGYQYYINGSEETIFDGQPSIMHNRTEFRAALNATVWIALSWSLLIDENAIGTLLGLNHGHCLNYIVDAEKFVSPKGTIIRNKDETVRTYVYTRASTFLRIFENSVLLADKKIDGFHYVNLFLMELFNVTNEVDGNPKPVHLKGHYPKVEDAIDYENAIEKIFEVITSDYQERKSAAMKVNLTGSCDGMKDIIDADARVGSMVLNPLSLGIELFNEKLAKAPEDIGLFISNLIKNTCFLRCMKSLPFFARFYTDLIECLDNKITADELDELTVLQALEKYDTSKTLLPRWKVFQEEWEPARATISGEIPNDRDLRQEITGRTPIGVLVRKDNIIMKTFTQGFAGIQEKLIEMRSSACARWNPLGLGWKESNEVINPNDLLAGADTTYNLISGETYPGELLGYILSEISLPPSYKRNEISFNYELIAKHLVWTYMAEARNIGDFRQAFKGEVKPVMEAEIDDTLEDLFVNTFDTMRSVSALKKSIARLEAYSNGHGDSDLAAKNEIIRKKMASVALLSKSPEDKQKFDRILDKYGESALLRITEYLYFVVSRVFRKISDPEAIKKFANISIGDVYNGAGPSDDDHDEDSEDDSMSEDNSIPTILVPFAKCLCCNLIWMSKNVIRRIEEKRYLFRDMEHYYRSEFSDEEQGHLDSFKEKMDNIEDIKEAQRYLDALSEIYEILNVSRFRLSPDTSIRSAFHADLAGLNEGRTKVCDELLPIEGGVQTSSYARLMGWMSVVIGELAEKSNDYSSLYSKEDAKNDDIMNLSSSSTLLAEDSDRGKLNLERVDDDDDDYNDDGDNNDDDDEEEELIII